MLDIWTASVETESPVIMWWYTPDPLVQKWKGTPGEFHPVALPDPTQECRLAQVDNEERCSEDLWTRRGNEEGKCGSPAHSLKKLVASSVRVQADATELASRSPGYETIKNFAVGKWTPPACVWFHADWSMTLLLTLYQFYYLVHAIASPSFILLIHSCIFLHGYSSCHVHKATWT